MPRLTKAYVERLPAAAKEYLVRDSELKGFCARIRPSGHRVWVVIYRYPPGRIGRHKTYTLGPVAQYSTYQVRLLAQTTLARIRQGQDPMAERARLRQGITVAEFAALYMTRYAAVKKKPGSVRMDNINLRLHVLPALGHRLLEHLTRGDIAACHARMARTPGAANRCLALLSTMLSLAIQWGFLAGENPARGIPRYREQARQRYLSGAEIQRLLATLEWARTYRQAPPAVIHLIRLLLYTGARLGELCTLRWQDVDLERHRAFLGDSKTGGKVLCLSSQAVALLASIERGEGISWVFPGRLRGKPLHNPHRAWYRLRAHAGLVGVRLHDLRHTAASLLVDAGTSLEIIGGLLGHRHTRTTARYAHLGTNPVQEASERLGIILEQLTLSVPVAEKNLL